MTKRQIMEELLEVYDAHEALEGLRKNKLHPLVQGLLKAPEGDKILQLYFNEAYGSHAYASAITSHTGKAKELVMANILAEALEEKLGVEALQNKVAVTYFYDIFSSDFFKAALKEVPEHAYNPLTVQLTGLAKKVSYDATKHMTEGPVELSVAIWDAFIPSAAEAYCDVFTLSPVLKKLKQPINECADFMYKVGVPTFVSADYKIGKNIAAGKQVAEIPDELMNLPTHYKINDGEMQY